MYETPFVPSPGAYAPPGYAPQMTAPLGRPGTVTAAAIMWIIYGGLSLLGNLMSLANPRAAMTTFIGVAIAIGFLTGGIQLLSGKARGVLAIGITSIVIGGLVLLACVALGGIVRELHAIAGLLVLIGLLFGGYLIVAGILGCAGNAKYQQWRRSTGRV